MQQAAKVEAVQMRSENGKYHTIRFSLFQRQGNANYKDVASVAPNLKELIELYLMVSHRKPQEKVVISRQGKSLLVEEANTGSKPGIVMAAMNNGDGSYPQVTVVLPPPQCVYLSGIVLGCIAMNMGCDHSTANNLINRWY